MSPITIPSINASISKLNKSSYAGGKIICTSFDRTLANGQKEFVNIYKDAETGKATRMVIRGHGECFERVFHKSKRIGQTSHPKSGKNIDLYETGYTDTYEKVSTCGKVSFNTKDPKQTLPRKLKKFSHIDSCGELNAVYETSNKPSLNKDNELTIEKHLKKIFEKPEPEKFEPSRTDKIIYKLSDILDILNIPGKIVEKLYR